MATDRFRGGIAQAKLAFNGLPAFRRRLTAGLRGLRPHPQGNNSLDLYPNAEQTSKTGE